MRARLVLLRALYREERAATPLRQARPDLWVRGFLSDRAVLYPDLSARHREYISVWAYETRLGALNSPQILSLFRDKMAFDKAVAAMGFGHVLPRTFATVVQGRVFLQFGDTTLLSNGAIAKPNLGSKGRDIHLVHSVDDLTGLSARGGDWIIQEKVIPHGYASTIHPGSLSTIRIHLVRDLSSGEPVIAAAMHRFGSTATGLVDNINAGGFGAAVDIESGTLSGLAGRSIVGRRVDLPYHPETGAQVEGVTVPHWQEAKALVSTLMSAFPAASSVGWDVAISDRGPLVIEANGNANPRVLQLHGPFATRDQRVADFYIRHGVLKPETVGRVVR